MKKLIAFFLIIVSMFSFFIVFNDQQGTQKNDMESAEQTLKYNYKIIIPTELSNRSQEGVYLKIKNALDKYKGNIYYSRVSGKDTKLTKYIYTSNADYYSKFKLSDGKFFDSSNIESDKYLSSIKSNDPKQIGTIATFAGVNFFEMRTLKNMVQAGYLLDGYATVSFNEPKSIDLFITELEKLFEVKGFQIEPFQELNMHGLPTTDMGIILSIYFIVMLLVLYDILKSYKTIGVEKLMGFSSKTIYIKRILSLFRFQLIITVISSGFMMLVMFKGYNQYLWPFLAQLAEIYLVEILGLLVICSIPFLYIHKIKISNMLKNKQPTTEIMVFNFFVKTILMVVFVLALNQGLNNFNAISNVFTNSYQQWDQTKNYAIVPNYSDIPIETMESNKFIDDQKNIYILFNRKGAILADFSEYVPDVRKMRVSETKYYYQRDNVKVNPNYLANYPIYNSNNQKISISENENAYVYLVPDKYKVQEKEIRAFYESMKDSRSPGFNQPIKLLWTKPNQKLFSMLIDINPNEGNYITDPIVRVLTELNGYSNEYDLLGVMSNPLKIKVDDYLSPANSIRPVLKQYGYDRYVKVISSVNEQIASQSKSIKEMLGYLGLTISLVGVCLFILILQSVYNFFEKYKQHIAIKQMHGFSMISKYKVYFGMILLNWLVVIISLLATRLISVPKLLGITFVSLMIELLISVMALALVNKRKVLKIIKGAN